MAKTKKQIFKQWLNRLRTKKKATFKFREVGGGMCALGHLCHVIDPNGWKKNGEWTYNGHTGVEKVDIWNMDVFSFIDKTKLWKICNLSDKNEGFNEVIKYIETNLTP